MASRNKKRTLGKAQWVLNKVSALVSNNIPILFFIFLFVQFQLSQFFSLPHPALPTPTSHCRSYPPLALSVGPLYMSLDDPSPSFLFIPLSPPLWQLSVCSCFHVAIFFLNLFCSLDSSYKQDHMVFVSLQGGSVQAHLL